MLNKLSRKERNIMTLKHWMVIKGVVVLLSGLALLVVPEILLNNCLSMASVVAAAIIITVRTAM